MNNYWQIPKHSAALVEETWRRKVGRLTWEAVDQRGRPGALVTRGLVTRGLVTRGLVTRGLGDQGSW